MIEELKKSWTALASQYNNDDLLVETYWDEILARYSSKKRHYHNLEHIHRMLELAKDDKDKVEYDIFLLAIWYHDIVYKSKRSDNELKSGDIAQNRVWNLGFGIKKSENVRQLIMCTKNHEIGGSSKSHYGFFLDWDLAILGTSWKEYLSYTEKIRKEYSMFPDFMYKKGRKKVLQHFLERPRIYYTEKYHDLWEANARKNIQKELTLL